MINNVATLNPAGNFEKFFKRLFGSHRGYIYCPITAPGNSEDWQPYFFLWPDEAAELASHISTKAPQHDIYFSPTLFKKPELQRELVYGTKFLWAEFNGEMPEEKLISGVPIPSMKIRTSTTGHEVWLWELDSFSIDLEDIEEFNKRIAFHLGADLSSWHHESVLRMPDTINQVAGMKTFLFDSSGRTSPVPAFRELPEAPKYLNEDAYTKLPNFEDVIATGSDWPVEEWKFFKKPDPLADRKKPVPESSKRKELHKAYRRLAFVLAELGYDDKEMLVVLLKADERWGLYFNKKSALNEIPKERQEYRRRRLVGIINLVRKHKPLSVYSDLDQEYPVMNFFELLRSNKQLEWAIEDLIEKQGMGMIVADSNVGKTRLMISLAIHMAIGRDFLIWKCPKPLKMLFASLEQNETALKFTLEHMLLEDLKLTEEEKELLEENFLLAPIGSSIHIEKPSQQPKFTRMVENFKPDGIVIDSLGAAVQDELESATVINRTLEYFNAVIRKKFGCFILFIHHNRKHGTGAPTKDDSFGSVYIRNQMSMVVDIHEKNPKTRILDVTNSKNRLAKKFDPFRCRGVWDSAKYELITGSGITAKALEPGTKTSVADKVLKNAMFHDFGMEDE